jgi:nucleotide-binding universal stress UspA family protein
MFTQILVPLDGSMFAEAAIGPAIGLAERARGRVSLMAVQGDPVDGPFLSARQSAHADDARRYLMDVLIRYRPVTSVPISIVVRHGLPAEEIVAEAVAAHDLIVMTSHGRGGLTRAWFGSVADECVRTSSIPVLVVRPLESAPASLRLEVSKVVVPLDGSRLAESVLPAATHFAELLDVPMTLVRSVVFPLTSYAGSFPPADAVALDPQVLIEEAREYLERIVSTRLAHVQPRPTVEVTMGPNAARDICDLAGPSGFVAMATHGWGGARRALMGSVSDKVIRAAEGVVLVLRPDRSIGAGGGLPEAIGVASLARGQGMLPA